jgi:hypothetical protein
MLTAILQIPQGHKPTCTRRVQILQYGLIAQKGLCA